MRELRTISHAVICMLVMLLCGVGAVAQDKPKPVKIKASAIQVDMIHSDEIKLPAEFQVSMYEDLVRQMEKKGGFAHVYREGDRNATSATDLVILRSNVTGFKEGSQRKREVTTVAGETEIKIHCIFSDKDGKTLLEAETCERRMILPRRRQKSRAQTFLRRHES
jgi:Domain of unknown function (DUF4410)